MEPHRVRDRLRAWTMAAALAGCGTAGESDGDSSDEGDESGNSCVPGASTACECADGRPGAQVCAPDGQSEPCMCETADGGDVSVGTSDASDDSSSGPESTSDASSTSDAGDTGSPSDAVCDDFERADLGPNWGIEFPAPPDDTQVAILEGSDLGLSPGPQGFFLVNWRGSTLAADQFSEATIPADVTDGWAHQVYVRWRSTDRARYGFGYDNDPSQKQFGSWYFKYDGVPSEQTRYFATAPATEIPAPGDTIRVEVEGYTLRGYLNDALVLEATDTDPSRIAEGEAGLAARWATGNQSTGQSAKVWESWCGGSL